MTEKTLSMEVHPMRGHSRGDWYCSLDDIAPREDEAEYWAIFGITHRRNKHCLGEFPTKKAAEDAMHGWRSVRRPVHTPMPRRASWPNRRRVTSPRDEHGKNVVQFEVVPDRKDASKISVVALCENGTIWRRDTEKGIDTGPIVKQWQRVSLAGLENLTPEEAFRLVITRLS